MTEEQLKKQAEEQYEYPDMMCKSFYCCQRDFASFGRCCCRCQDLHVLMEATVNISLDLKCFESKFALGILTFKILTEKYH